MGPKHFVFTKLGGSQLVVSSPTDKLYPSVFIKIKQAELSQTHKDFTLARIYFIGLALFYALF